VGGGAGGSGVGVGCHCGGGWGGGGTRHVGIGFTGIVQVDECRDKLRRVGKEKAEKNNQLKFQF